MTLVTTSVGGNDTISTPSPDPTGPGGLLLSQDLIKLANVLAAQVGMIFDYAGETAPTGYFMCDGSQVFKLTYPALYAVVGDRFNAIAPTSSLYFRLPDYRYRVSIGVSSTNLDAGNRPDVELSGTGGERLHTLTEIEMPTHNHTGWDGFQATSSSPIPSANFAAGNRGPSVASTGSTGGGQAHNNMQPFIAMNKIIRY